MAAIDQLQLAGRNHELALVVGADRPGAENAPSRTASDLKPWQIAGFAQGLAAGEAALEPLFAAVAQLPVQFWLTAAIGGALPAALSAAGRPPNVHVADDDWLDRTLDRPDLLRLRGDVAHPGRLVITADDYRRLPDNGRIELTNRALQWLTENAVLLLGCDPAEGSDFDELIFPRLLQKPGAFRDGGFLVWPGPSDVDVARWLARGIAVVDADPVQFVEALAGALNGIRPVDPEAARFGRMAQILAGRPTASMIRTEVAAVPQAERTRSVTITLSLDLTDDKRLAFTWNVVYQPDMGIPPNRGGLTPTDITLDELRTWARVAERLRNNGLQPDDVAGRDFFNRLLPPESGGREKYRQALFLGQILSAEVTIVLELLETDGRLWSAPWELLHDGDVAGMEPGAGGRGFLGLTYPTYRWIAAVTGVEQASGSLRRALVVAADPFGTLAGLDGEVDWLVGVLEDEGIEVDFHGPDDDDVADPARIADLIRQESYDLFHFAGHGQFDEGDPLLSALVLGRREQAERDRLLRATGLAQAARDGRLKLVVFSACQVGAAGDGDAERPWEVAGLVTGMLRAGVPAAVGMRWNIEDDASRKLIETTYRALLQDDTSIEAALMAARQALFNEDRADWTNPILTKKHDLFDGTGE